MRAHISVVFDLDVLVKLRDLAKAQGTTPSKLVESIVLQWLKEDGKLERDSRVK